MTWLRVSNFKIQLKAYRERAGKTNAQVAVDLKTTPGTLKFWLSGTRPPHIESLQWAATVFGCSVTEFVDDPNQEVAGQSTEGMSEKGRFLSSLMFDKFNAPDLTDEDREILFKEFLQNDDKLRSIKAIYEKKP